MSLTAVCGAKKTSLGSPGWVLQNASYSRWVMPRDVRPPGSSGSSTLPPSLTRTNCRHFWKLAAVIASSLKDHTTDGQFLRICCSCILRCNVRLSLQITDAERQSRPGVMTQMYVWRLAAPSPRVRGEGRDEGALPLV